MFDKRNQLVFYANISSIAFGISVILLSDFLLIGVLFIVAAGLLIYEQLKQNKGTFSISGLEKKLTIKDTCGSKADLVQKQITSACHVDNSVYWFKHIHSAGSIGNFLINGQYPVKQSKDDQGNYQVCMTLPTQPKATSGLDTVLSCTHTGAYGQTQCALSHMVDDETDQLKLIVELPEGRPITSAQAYCVHEGNKAALLPPVVTGQTRIEAEIENPQLGAEYRLEWVWPEANLIRKIGCFLK